MMVHSPSTVSCPSVFYVFTGKVPSRAADMLRLSVASLCARNESLPKILFSDDASAAEKDFASLAAHFEYVHVSELSGCPAVRSRHLKTSLGLHATGDFIFLDSDTIVVSDLLGGFDEMSEMGMVPDMQYGGREFTVQPGHHVELARKLGLPLTCSRLLNSGVIFARASDRVRGFYDFWHRLWSRGVEFGEYRDQPTLGLAMQESKVQIDLLPPRFNAMVARREAFRKTAVVLHFFGSEPDASHRSVYGRLLELQAETRDLLPAEIIDAELKRRVPLVHYGRPRFHWEAGDPAGAVRAYLKCRGRRLLAAIHE